MNRVPEAPAGPVPVIEARLSRFMVCCCKSCTDTLPVVPALVVPALVVPAPVVPVPVVLVPVLGTGGTLPARPVVGATAPRAESADCKLVKSCDRLPVPVCPFACDAALAPPANASSAEFVPLDIGDTVPPVIALELDDVEIPDDPDGGPPASWPDCAPDGERYAASCAQRSRSSSRRSRGSACASKTRRRS